MIKNLSALALAATLGAGGATAVLSGTQGVTAPVYRNHAVDVREISRAPDGGVNASVTAYARRQLSDGGWKDVGGYLCKNQKAIERTGAALLKATEVCVAEDL